MSRVASKSSSVSSGKPTIRSVVSENSGSRLLIAAVHASEHVVAAALHGKMKMLCHLFAVEYRVDELL